jgi:cellulose 1,4-beta-cellobiosidase
MPAVGGGKTLVKKVLVLACLLAAGVPAVPLGASGAAGAAVAGPAAAAVTWCGSNEHLVVHNRFGARFQVRDAYWRGQRPQCLRNHRDLANFTITQRAGFDPAGRVVAFPNIMRGCIWGICSPHAGIPLKVSSIHRPVTSWHTRQGVFGTYNAAYDIWFGKTKMTRGQATGAELMIWLNLHGGCCALQPGAPRVWIGHRPYRLSHWRTFHNGVSWNYIQFRMIHHTWHVDHLHLWPFIRRAIHLHLIRRWWWMENIEAGFELWSGGQGLKTTSFAVRMR